MGLCELLHSLSWIITGDVHSDALDKQLDCVRADLELKLKQLEEDKVLFNQEKAQVENIKRLFSELRMYDDLIEQKSMNVLPVLLEKEADYAGYVKEIQTIATCVLLPEKVRAMQEELNLAIKNFAVIRKELLKGKVCKLHHL
jgi:hypothetical protein